MKKSVLFCLALVLAFVWAMPVFADQLSDTAKQKNNIDSKINSIEQQKKQEQKKLNDLKQKQKTLDKAQQQKKTEIKNVQENIKEAEEDIRTINDAINDAEEKYRQQREFFKTRLRVMYQNTSSSYLEALIESKSIADFFERLEIISAISKNDKELIDQIVTAKKDIEYKKLKAEEGKLALQNQAKEKQTALNTLQVSRASTDENARKIKQKLDQLEKEEDELNRISEQLNEQIRNLQKKGTKYAGGSMKWPVPSSGYISSGYGNRLHPILKKYRMHSGIDISAKSGVSIIAANKGTVVYSGWQSGYGNTVIVDHGGGITTLYAHCSRLLVGVGDNVGAGDVIAKIGSTGLSTGPHLHFEVRKDGATQDPTNYVSY